MERSFIQKSGIRISWTSHFLLCRDRAVRQVVALEACGYDGIWLDEWNEKSILDRVEGRTPPDNDGIFRGVVNEFEARMTILRRIREAVSDDFLILVNSNADKVLHSAPYVNGMFMETHSYGYKLSAINTN